MLHYQKSKTHYPSTGKPTAWHVWACELSNKGSFPPSPVLWLQGLFVEWASLNIRSFLLRNKLGSNLRIMKFSFLDHDSCLDLQKQPKMDWGLLSRAYISWRASWMWLGTVSPVGIHIKDYLTQPPTLEMGQHMQNDLMKRSLSRSKKRKNHCKPSSLFL
jgi:hypothetical protein